jgi:lysozyme
MIEIKKLIEFTGINEGLRLKTYICPAGKETIGYGHNLTDNNIPYEIKTMMIKDNISWNDKNWKNLSITEKIATALFEYDIQIAESDLKSIFIDYETFSERRKIALIDMVFNMGSNKFRQFKNMINAIKLGMWNVAANEAKNSNWYKQVTNRANKVIKMLKEG